MGGITALKRIQWGVETAAGTAIAADMVWRGTGEMQDARELVMVNEEVGSLLPVGNQYEAHKEAIITFDEVEATFEHLPLIMDCGIELVQTGATDTDGSGKIYAYTLATGAVSTPNTVTLEVGDNQRADEAEYCFVTKFTLSGASKEAWKLSAEWVGRQVTDCELTSPLTPVAVEPILFGKTNFYLDTAGGTLGTTTKSNTLVGFNIEWVTGHIPLYAADGNDFFSARKTVAPGITGSFTFEHDTTGEAEINAARARSLRKIRLKAEGTTLTSAGTTYTYKTAQIDLEIQYDDIGTMGDVDGNRTVELPWHAVDGVVPAVTIVNQIANL